MVSADVNIKVRNLIKAQDVQQLHMYTGRTRKQVVLHYT